MFCNNNTMRKGLKDWTGRENKWCKMNKQDLTLGWVLIPVYYYIFVGANTRQRLNARC